jgi:hypothetical protein
VTLEPSVHVRYGIGSSCRRRNTAATRLGLGVLLAVVVAGLLAPPAQMGFARSNKDVASLAINQLVHDLYPRWQLAHPDRTCPPNVFELVSDAKRLVDPWGQPYWFSCDPWEHPGARALSIGEDGRLGTEDDIKSWE